MTRNSLSLKNIDSILRSDGQSLLDRRMNAGADVHSRDFLHKYAETPLSEEFLALGALCRLSTNSEHLLEAARRTFSRVETENTLHPAEGPCFFVRVWVDERDLAQRPWPKPYIRGLDHLVYLGLDLKSSLLVDLATRRVIGRVSSCMADDCEYWRNTVFPMLMSILAGSIGLVELHASCVAKGESGIVLLGPGKSGKSTLARAMSNRGFRVLSDDRVFCSIQGNTLCGYGLPRPIKLRQDAERWFEELQFQQPGSIQSGEPVFLIDPGPPSPHPCEPKAIVRLERSGTGCRISQIGASEMRGQIESELLAETPEIMARQGQTIDRLLEVPCWHLQHNTHPEITAGRLTELLAAS